MSSINNNYNHLYSPIYNNSSETESETELEAVEDASEGEVVLNNIRRDHVSDVFQRNADEAIAFNNEFEQNLSQIEGSSEQTDSLSESEAEAFEGLKDKCISGIKKQFFKGKVLASSAINEIRKIHPTKAAKKLFEKTKVVFEQMKKITTQSKQKVDSFCEEHQLNCGRAKAIKNQMVGIFFEALKEAGRLYEKSHAIYADLFKKGVDDENLEECDLANETFRLGQHVQLEDVQMMLDGLVPGLNREEKLKYYHQANVFAFDVLEKMNGSATKNAEPGIALTAMILVIKSSQNQRAISNRSFLPYLPPSISLDDLNQMETKFLKKIELPQCDGSEHDYFETMTSYAVEYAKKCAETFSFANEEFIKPSSAFMFSVLKSSLDGFSKNISKGSAASKQIVAEKLKVLFQFIEKSKEKAASLGGDAGTHFAKFASEMRQEFVNSVEKKNVDLSTFYLAIKENMAAMGGISKQKLVENYQILSTMLKDLIGKFEKKADASPAQVSVDIAADKEKSLEIFKVKSHFNHSHVNKLLDEYLPALGEDLGFKDKVEYLKHAKLLVSRFMNNAKGFTSPSMRRNIDFTALLISVKYGQDYTGLYNADILQFLGVSSISVQQLNQMEREFLKVIEWNVIETYDGKLYPAFGVSEHSAFRPFKKNSATKINTFKPFIGNNITSAQRTKMPTIKRMDPKEFTQRKRLPFSDFIVNDKSRDAAAIKDKNLEVFEIPSRINSSHINRLLYQYIPALSEDLGFKDKTEYLNHAKLLVSRFMNNSKGFVSPNMKSNIEFTALLIAVKYGQDYTGLYNADILQFLGVSSISVQQLNQMEREFLKGINWNVIETHDGKLHPTFGVGKYSALRPSKKNSAIAVNTLRASVPIKQRKPLRLSKSFKPNTIHLRPSNQSVLPPPLKGKNITRNY